MCEHAACDRQAAQHATRSWRRLNLSDQAVGSLSNLLLYGTAAYGTVDEWCEEWRARERPRESARDVHSDEPCNDSARSPPTDVTAKGERSVGTFEVRSGEGERPHGETPPPDSCWRRVGIRCIDELRGLERPAVFGSFVRQRVYGANVASRTYSYLRRTSVSSTQDRTNFLRSRQGRATRASERASPPKRYVSSGRHHRIATPGRRRVGLVDDKKLALDLNWGGLPRAFRADSAGNGADSVGAIT
jgi:hypothetical protein